MPPAGFTTRPSCRSRWPWWLWLVVAVPHSPAFASTLAVTAQPAPRLQALQLEAWDVDESALLDALRLRLDDVDVRSFRGRSELRADAGLVLYVRIIRRDAESVELTVIASDGRGYQRRVEADRSIEARAIAGTLAVLAHAIADGTEIADKADAEIPDERTAESKPAPAAEPPPVVDEPQPDESIDESPPESVATSEGADEPPPPSRAQPAVLMTAAAGILVPIAPNGATGPQYAAQLEAQYQSRRRRFVGLSLRYAGQQRVPYLLQRYRVAIVAGQTLARGAFRLPVGLGLSIEPWAIRNADGPRPLTTDEGPSRYHPLYGLQLSARPSYVVGSPSEHQPTVAIGVALDLGASVEFSDRMGVPAIQPPAGGERFGLGGFEFAAMLQVTTWFPLGSTR